MCLFYLGLANYSLGKAIGDRGQMRQGMQFFQQSAAISNPDAGSGIAQRQAGAERTRRQVTAPLLS